MARKRTSSIAKLCLSITTKIVPSLLIICSTGCDLLPRPPAPTAADYCDVNVTAPQINDVVLEVWAPDARQHCLRLYAPLLAARQVDGISVFAVEKNINSGPFREALLNAVKSRSAPDIAFLHNGPTLKNLANNGYLHSIGACDLPTQDWTTDIFHQREWGYPFEIEALMLFYSKTILRDLGWPSARINELPRDLANGTVNSADLLTIAQQAVNSGVVKKGFAFTVHENRYYSAMHLFKSNGGKYATRQELFAHNREALTNTYKFYEQLRNYQLTHPAISQESISNVSNRFSIRDALANGKILFAHTVVSEWKRMLLDHTESESQLSSNIGIALYPEMNGQASTIISDMGSYVIFSEKATGKSNQSASCKVIEAISRSDLHRQHATNTSQLAPEFKSIWAPQSLPTVALEQLRHGFQYHPHHIELTANVKSMTEKIANGEISAGQAAATTARLIQLSAE